MIDVVFLLIIFFMLVAQITRQQIVELELPAFEPSAAAPVLEDGRLVLNVVPLEDRVRLGALYIAGGLAFAPGAQEETRLVEVLRATAAREAGGSGPPLEVLLRASAGERYSVAHHAMDLVRRAGIGSVHLMTLDESDAARLRRAGRDAPEGGAP
ncbi:MAG: ExbD/TolR family protein [Phycisphaerales bacterium]